MPPMSDKWRLVLLSFLMLFVELALIRWTGSNIVYLSYFSNFVLLGSFLGIGLGFLRARARRDLYPWAPVALALLVLFVLVFPVEIRRAGGGVLYYGALESSGPPRALTLTVIFIAVAATMTFIGEGVAATFVLLLGRRVTAVAALALVGVVVMLTIESVQADTSWSPYYKITVHRKNNGTGPPEISVNGIPHQVVLPSVRNPLYARPYE